MRQQIDERVAREVMGWHLSPATKCYWFTSDDQPTGFSISAQMSILSWQPSKQIEQTWMVVEKMKKDGWMLLLSQQIGGLWVAGFNNVDDPKVSDDADTAPMAICLAALEATGGVVLV